MVAGVRAGTCRDRDYWTAFGAMVIVVTATRAMVQWGLAGPNLESDNPLVGAWEAVVDEAQAPMSEARPLVAADERVHPVDPAAWSWSESWFFSWIDLDGGPAGFFRVGVLPNQRRAMLWSFVHVDGQWLGVEESRLAFDDLDLTDGVAYDTWGLRFGWRPDPPLEGAQLRLRSRRCSCGRGPAPVPTCRCRSTCVHRHGPRGADGIG